MREAGTRSSIAPRTAITFRTDSKIFSPTEFLAEVLQHLPDARNRLIRCYGLYSSRARGTWSRTPYLLRLAPEGWKRDHAPPALVRVGPSDEQQSDCAVTAKQSHAAWARLIKKVYEVDPLSCSRCGKPMKGLAVITTPRRSSKSCDPTGGSRFHFYGARAARMSQKGRGDPLSQK